MRNPTETKAAGNLFSWSMRDDWWAERETTLQDHLAAAAENFSIRRQELPEVLGTEVFAMLMQWIVEDLFTRRFGEDDRNVVDEYLKRRGWRESASGKRYLQTMRDSIPSLYEVVDLKPGHYLVLRDLLRGGDPVTVEEKLGSETAAPWDRLAARVVDINGRPGMTGALLHFERGAADTLVEIFSEADKRARQAPKRGAATSAAAIFREEASSIDLLLADAGPVFSRVWLTCALTTLAEPPPSFINNDGEEIAFVRVGFPVIGDPSEIAARLDTAPFLEGDPEHRRRWDWREQASLRWSTDMPSGRTRTILMETQGSGGRRVLGGIELAGSHLVLDVNSRERAERGKTLLGSLLGDLVGAPVVSVQSVEQALAERKDRPRQTDDGAVPPEIAAPIVKEFLDEHYRQCLDNPLPVLDGKSPRQAVRSKRGRDQVVDWLKDAENLESRRSRSSGTEPYDFTWMWRELGILDRRA